MINFRIESEFESEDEFGTDPYGYSLFIDDKLAAGYGDDYHDKGREKCQAFIEGYCYAKEIAEDFSISYKNVVIDDV